MFTCNVNSLLGPSEIFGFDVQNRCFYKYELVFEIIFKLFKLNISYTENALQTEIPYFRAYSEENK